MKVAEIKINKNSSKSDVEKLVTLLKDLSFHLSKKGIDIKIESAFVNLSNLECYRHDKPKFDLKLAKKVSNPHFSESDKFDPIDKMWVDYYQSLPKGWLL